MTGMSDHYRRIYQLAAADYHALIAREDVDGHLLPALRAAAGSLTGRRVLDVGSGTGRLPLLLHPHVAALWAVDRYGAMLREQAGQRERTGGGWRLLQGDARALPLANAAFDLVTAGWALGHFVGWYGEGWPAQLQRALAEMTRVAAPGGRLLICETMGTGSDAPAPPTAGLAAYYRRLVDVYGFEQTIISTDYLFRDLAEAERLARFFFGPLLAEKVRARGWQRLPEWTALFQRAV